MTADPSQHRRRVALIVTGAVAGVPAFFAVLLGVGLLLHRVPGRGPDAAPSDLVPTFVGMESCSRCHEAETEAWVGSHHDLAMQPATEETVHGDFDDAVFEHRSFRGRFFRRDGGFFVETQDAEGGLEAFEIVYVFGVVPLQQYLIAFPDGRLQALTAAWDTRPTEDGGQRWFHLYPDEDTPPGDELHWTAPAFNWNFACAECHSTDLRKNYDPATDTFATSWAEIDVSCESCHGPGSVHVQLASARERDPGAPYPEDHGLVARPSGPGDWRFAEGARVAGLAGPPIGDPEVESCGRCHARRSQLAEVANARTLHDSHWVEGLTEGLYFADGQIRDEVYVYGSFKQSKMHAMGVTCSDCHEPHSLKLRAPGNALCASCHAPSAYDTPAHHFHEQGTEGASCVECHMPERTYMVVDPRRDHSMRIPRPDLTVSLGVPNACNTCHADKPAQWAADAVVGWYGEGFNRGFQSYAPTLHAARLGAPGSREALERLASEPAAPGIARATAFLEMGAVLGPDLLPSIRAGLGDTDPMVRRAACESLAAADPAARLELLAPMLRDPVLAVRVAAVTNLLDQAPDAAGDAAAPLRDAIEEFEAVQRLNADRASAWLNLARMHALRGRADEALRCFEQARRREPAHFPVYANEADFCRELGREADAERVLREGLARLPGHAALRHSLGLLLVRTGRADEAMEELAAAHLAAPDDARFGYVYGVALDSLGDPGAAVEAWDRVLEAHPYHLDSLYASAVAHLRLGHGERAHALALRCRELLPGSPEIEALLEAAAGRLPASND